MNDNGFTYPRENANGKKLLDYHQLLLSINRCPQLQKARKSSAHPCSDIVGLQPADAFQAPEPWRGHIETAPILFISSNPSIDGEETFPPCDWPDEKIISYYRECFDRGYAGPYPIDQKIYNSVRFWTSVRARASEILDRPAVQGTDFALTEVVHCKSQSEKGVHGALMRCAELWLESVIEQSGARVLVVLGEPAKKVCSERWGINPRQRVHFSVSTPGRRRAVLFLPHTNARGNRKLEHHTSEPELLRLRLLASSK